ncbi:MAG: hypothetical protein ACI39W_07995 [Brotaphodocola sp.]
MKKQTKFVVTTCAATLLALGASMTSFAATGWVEDDGQWFYYDKDGNKVEDEWKKSGENWYWLDSELGGAMAVSKLIEDDDDIYFVDENGVMISNSWVKLENEEQDDEEDPAEFNYYYMQANGKAYKASGNGKTKFRTIDGKKYAFDEDGKMLYGWVNGDSERLTDDEDWNANAADEDIYYLGSWEDGAMKTGWQKLTVYDSETEEDEEYWFWFKSNGKKYTAEAGSIMKTDKSINGKKYGFDERGVMAYSWALTTDSNANAHATGSNWLYYSNPEDGARANKGWFKVVAPNDNIENTFKDYGVSFAEKDADDETERWYYANGDGQVYQGEIKKINGNYYGFWPEFYEDGSATGKGGAMLTGLCALKVVDGKILNVYESNMDIKDMLDCLNADDEKYLPMHIPGSHCSLYYFGNNEDTDGAMRFGTSTVYVSGLPLTFEFSKSGGVDGKGKGVNGIKDGKYIYKFGYKMTADADEKYRLFYASGNVNDDDAIVFQVDTDVLRSTKVAAANKNKDGDTIHFVGTMNGSGLPWEKNDNLYYLVNTSGKIVEDKKAAKDGYDWYYYVEDKVVKMYTDSKDLNGDTKADAPADANGAALKDVWDTKADVCIEETEDGKNPTPEIGEIMKYSGERTILQGIIEQVSSVYDNEAALDYVNMLYSLSVK